MTQHKQFTSFPAFGYLTASILALAFIIAFSLITSTSQASIEQPLDSDIFLPLLMRPREFEAIPSSAQFSQVTDIASAGDERLFIVERLGKIFVQDAAGNSSLFLDLGSKLDTEGERGLLGLAFHPDYASNGYFYVTYTARLSPTEGRSYVSRFSVSSNPNVANINSERQLFSVFDSLPIHNGGALRFAADGTLYTTVGDDATPLSAQDPASPKGRVWRLDVGDGEEGLLSSAPIANGLRNAWRIAIDPVNGDIFAGDVGKGTYEEINFIRAGTSGQNFGWPCFEGPLVQENASVCDGYDAYTPAAFLYRHNIGCAVTVGQVYRANPRANRRVIYGDFCRGVISAIEQVNGVWESTDLGELPNGTAAVTTFGVDNQGTIYVGTLSDGPIYKLYIPPTP